MVKTNAPKDIEQYRKLYAESIENREEFWRQQSEMIQWDQAFDTIVDEDFSTGEISWFAGGKLNACANALDIHSKNGRAEDKALTYYDRDGNSQTFSYGELLLEVTSLAASLKSFGLKAGDRVVLYLHDSPESVFFMLACARSGIICVPVPERYTSEIVNEIIRDCKASMIVVSLDTDQASYTARVKALVEMFDDVVIVTTGKTKIDGTTAYSDLISRGQDTSQDECASVDAEHPLFILYAGSATGIPRGSVFATGGFIVQAAASFSALFQPAFDESEKWSIACCTNLASTAGQCYGLWGPLISGSGIIIAGEGDKPSTGLLRQMLDERPVPALFTTPGLLTALKRELGDDSLAQNRRFPFVACYGDILTPRFVVFAGKSLTSGPERVINMWVQSESGAALIHTYAHGNLNSPGTLGLPFFGIKAQNINHLGEICRTNESGQLVFENSWPGMIRTIWGQHERFIELYFQRIPGYFNTNDGVRVDNNGFFWFMGRLDDVIKVRGQSIATSEIEAVLMSHPMIAESAVVSIEGEEDEEIIAYVVTEKLAEAAHDTLISDLTNYIEQRIGEFAKPARFVITEELPRTRTGKIVRRLLRRIAAGSMNAHEDLSHVANPEAVDKLINK